MSTDSNAAPQEVATQQVAPSVWMRSECCFDHATQDVATYETNAGAPPEALDENGNASWAGVTFTCNACGQPCRCYTSPPLARLAAQAQGKEIIDDA